MSTVRITATVVRTDSGWSVSVALPDGEILPARELARAAGFPQPPAQSPLAADGNGVALSEVFDRLILREPQGDDVAAFGRYLFDVLLAPDWDRIVAAAGADGIEIALHWDPLEHELNRLPWELMHGHDNFLAADQRRIAITRLVVGAGAELTELPAALRVLFVIGTDLKETSIRPGAEYLGLLRRLQTQGLGFVSRALVHATRQSLADELAQWKPPVVHFICHGRFEEGQSVLELTSDKEPSERDLVDAAQLLGVMRDALPKVVVLNACHSGGLPVRTQAASLAAQLVAGGIPMVVGMSGRVADHACRLFTRRFYEALLQGESVVAATAEARRAGHTGANPLRTVDWAFPTLFLSEAASPTVQVEPGQRDLVTRLHHFADRFRAPARTPKVFCDRFDFLEIAYHRLMRIDAPFGPRVLGIRAQGVEQGVELAKYGKTRLLEELAAQAAAEGNVPCLVTFATGDDTPITLAGLGMALLRAMQAARASLASEQFAVSTAPDSRVLQVLERAAGKALGAPVSLGDVEQDFIWRVKAVKDCVPGITDPEALPLQSLSLALRRDLSALAEEARAHLPGATVVVLIDEVHRFDTAASDLIALLDPYGLGVADNPVPVAFAYSTSQDPRYATALRDLNSFLESRMWAERLDLRPFDSPFEDPVPYQQYLLHGIDAPLVVSSAADPDEVKQFYELLAEEVAGFPSKLEWPGTMRTLIRAATRMGNCLEPADDEAILEELRRH